MAPREKRIKASEESVNKGWGAQKKKPRRWGRIRGVEKKKKLYLWGKKSQLKGKTGSLAGTSVQTGDPPP